MDSPLTNALALGLIVGMLAVTWVSVSVLAVLWPFGPVSPALFIPWTDVAVRTGTQRLFSGTRSFASQGARSALAAIHPARAPRGARSRQRLARRSSRFVIG